VTRKKHTTLAVLRRALGPYEGREEIFAATVQCSVSWVKKASAGIRPITPKTARKVSHATGVSEDWLMAADPREPILGHDNVTPFTEEFYCRWRQLTVKPVRQIDCGVVAKFTADVLRSVFAGVEQGRMNTAVNDLWKFSKVMKARYGVPRDTQQSVGFSRDVAAGIGELSLKNDLPRNDDCSVVFPDNS